MELPPSPWRLLRSLYAVWRTRVSNLDEPIVHGLLEALSVPPTASVPPHTIEHTRHYYPNTQHTRACYSVDKTLDAFAVFDRNAELVVSWPDLELAAEQADALAKLASSLPYLGRADSVCEARVLGSGEDREGRDHTVWRPLDVAEHVPDGVEVTTRLAPQPPLNLESLTARPVDVRQRNLLFPRGTRLVGYQATKSEQSRRRHPRTRRAGQVTAVRFSIAQSVLPPATDSLVYTDLLRSAALSKLGRRRTEPEETLLGGRTAQRDVSAGDHRHAHFLPLIENHALAGLLAWVPGQLPSDELESLLDVRNLQSMINERWRATIRVSGYGRVDDVARELCGETDTWVSVAPYSPTIRYGKKSWDLKRFMTEGIRRDLRHRPELGDIDAEVELLDPPWWRGFRQHRPSKAGTRTASGVMIRVRLSAAVPGPLALGRLSHFGLGLFQPDHG